MAYVPWSTGSPEPPGDQEDQDSVISAESPRNPQSAIGCYRQNVIKDRLTTLLGNLYLTDEKKAQSLKNVMDLVSSFTEECVEMFSTSFEDVLPDVGYSDTEYTEDGCKIPQRYIPTLNDSNGPQKENKFREAVTTRLKVNEILKQKWRRFEKSPKCRSGASSPGHFHRSGRTTPTIDGSDGHNLTTQAKASLSCPGTIDVGDKQGGSDDIPHVTTDEKVMDNVPIAEDSDGIADSGLQNLSYTSEASNTSITSANIIMDLSIMKGNIGPLQKVEELPSEAKNDVMVDEKDVELEDPTTDINSDEPVIKEGSEDLNNLSMVSEKSEDLDSRAEFFDDHEEKKENPCEEKVEHDALRHVKEEPDGNLQNPEENLEVLQKEPVLNDNNEKTVDNAEITDGNQSNNGRECATDSEEYLMDDISSISAKGDMETADITHAELMSIIAMSDTRSNSTLGDEIPAQKKNHRPFGKMNDAFYRDETDTLSDITLDEEEVKNITRSTKKGRSGEDTGMIEPVSVGGSETRRDFRSESPNFSDVTLDLQRSNASTPVVGNVRKSCYNGGNSKTQRRVSDNVSVRYKSDFGASDIIHATWVCGRYEFTEHENGSESQVSDGLSDTETSATGVPEDETAKFYRYFGFLHGEELNDTEVLIAVDGSDSDLDEEP